MKILGLPLFLQLRFCFLVFDRLLESSCTSRCSLMCKVFLPLFVALGCCRYAREDLLLLVSCDVVSFSL